MSGKWLHFNASAEYVCFGSLNFSNELQTESKIYVECNNFLLTVKNQILFCLNYNSVNMKVQITKSLG